MDQNQLKKKIYHKLELREKNYHASCIYFHVLQITSHKEILRHGRIGTAKKCTPEKA